MSHALTIDWNHPSDRDAILVFIAAMGFTPRDVTTWDGLSMRAIVARRGDAIAGVLPIEFRTVCVGEGRVMQAAHQTCVALAPDERGQGLGSRMQRRLDESLPPEVELITVYREDPTSRAYAWYRRNGFEPQMAIESRQLSVPADASDAPLTIAADAPWLASAWRRAGKSAGCFVDQTERRLADWLAMHPYLSRYAFEVVALDERAYAVVGIGQLHSAAPRLDVLDWVATNEADAKELLDACRRLASARGALTVRIALAERDPLHHLIDGECTWRFEMLAKWRGSRVAPRADGWRYASIDFA